MSLTTLVRKMKITSEQEARADKGLKTFGVFIIGAFFIQIVSRDYFFLQLTNYPDRRNLLMLLNYASFMVWGIGISIVTGLDAKGGLTRAIWKDSPLSPIKTITLYLRTEIVSYKIISLIVLTTAGNLPLFFYSPITAIFVLLTSLMLYAGIILLVSFFRDELKIGKGIYSKKAFFTLLIVLSNPLLTFKENAFSLFIFNKQAFQGISSVQSSLWVDIAKIVFTLGLGLLAIFCSLFYIKLKPKKAIKWNRVKNFYKIKTPRTLAIFDLMSLWRSHKILPAVLISISSLLLINGPLRPFVFTLYLGAILFSLLFYLANTLYFDHHLIKAQGRDFDNSLYLQKSFGATILLIILYLPPLFTAAFYGFQWIFIVITLVIALSFFSIGMLSTIFLHQAMPKDSASPGSWFFLCFFVPILFASESKGAIYWLSLILVLSMIIPLWKMTRKKTK